MFQRVQQKTGSDCALAAIAMALGRTYDALWTPADTESVAQAKGADTAELLEKLGLVQHVHFRKVYTYHSELSNVKALLWRRRAILSVKSLNRENGNHAVYWDGFCLHDPSPDRTYLWISSVIIDAAVIFDEAPLTDAFPAG